MNGINNSLNLNGEIWVRSHNRVVSYLRKIEEKIEVYKFIRFDRLMPELPQEMPAKGMKYCITDNKEKLVCNYTELNKEDLIINNDILHIDEFTEIQLEDVSNEVLTKLGMQGFSDLPKLSIIKRKEETEMIIKEEFFYILKNYACPCDKSITPDSLKKEQLLHEAQVNDEIELSSFLKEKKEESTVAVFNNTNDFIGIYSVKNLKEIGLPFSTHSKTIEKNIVYTIEVYEDVSMIPDKMIETVNNISSKKELNSVIEYYSKYYFRILDDDGYLVFSGDKDSFSSSIFPFKESLTISTYNINNLANI